MSDKCKNCDREGEHYCTSVGRTVSPSSDGDFFTSMAISGLTNSSVLGAMFGGSISGAILGDVMNDGDLDLF